MLGIRLFIHALKMLFHDFGVTLRITMLPLFLGYGLAFGIIYLLFGTEFFDVMTGKLNPMQATQPFFPAMLILLVITALTYCWSAIAWHRFVLLQERPESMLPGIQWSGVGRYLWAGIKIFLVVLFVMVPVMFLFAQFRMVIFANPFAPPLMAVLIVFALLLLGATLVFRIALVLPATAIGQPISLLESWKATTGYFLALVGVVLFLAAVRGVTAVFPAAGLVGLVPVVALSWLSYALAVSVLTTLYGVCVEKRDL